jgi:succinate dehydrogenase/fumarate reductase flavoprotein subunit
VIELISTDVLVIGGGAAGSSAALKAADEGAEVTLVVKGLLGKSGCSVFASQFPYHDTSSERMVHNRMRYAIRYYNHYLADQEYFKRMDGYMRSDFYPDLERIGVYWAREDDGRVQITASGTPSIVAHKQGASGMILMDKRRREILRRGIAVHEECAVTSLVTDEGRVVGATVLDYRRGRFYCIAAHAVILATGHADYLATRATGTREQSADGIAMALRAGAELANLEIQWWHTSDVLAPKSWMRLHIYPNPLMGTKETSRLYNSLGEMFYEQKTHSPAANAPYTEQIRRLAREVANGNARWDGGYYSGYDHIPADTTRKYQHQSKIWAKLGLDVGKDRIECGATLHMRQGGLCVDTRDMSSTLPGLHIAGAIGCHYLGGVGPVSYDGKVAGIAGANAARGKARKTVSEALLAEEHRRVFRFLREGADGVRPVHAKTRIREIMWELGYVKNESKMQNALAQLEAVRRDMMPRLTLGHTSPNWNTGWLDALDAESMLDACEATVCSGLNRKESRGPFYREDYPYVDNENWIARNILWRDGGSYRSRVEPIPVPYLQPEKSREPFFETDY